MLKSSCSVKYLILSSQLTWAPAQAALCSFKVQSDFPTYGRVIRVADLWLLKLVRTY